MIVELQDMITPYVPPFLHHYFLYPEALLIFPVLILLFWLIVLWPRKIRKEVTLGRGARMVHALIIVIFRTMSIGLILVGVASPFIPHERTITGELSLKVLVDNSSSMGLYDTGFLDTALGRLRERMDVEVFSSGSSLASTPAQDALGHAKPGDAVLLVTDGRVTDGMDWNDVAGSAIANNITFYAMKLPLSRQDYAVHILSPTKTTIGAAAPIGIQIEYVGTARSAVHVKVAVDGATVYDQETKESMVQLTQTFVAGDHKIEATIVPPAGADTFPENNAAVRVVKATPRPHVVLVTERPDAPLARIAREMYRVDVVSQIPEDLSTVHALILNDVPATRLTGDVVSRLTDYVVDGNGLFVVGGQQSFDKGGYKNTQLETILPGFVGASGTTGGSSSIVLLVDVSGSTGYALESGAMAVDVEKALLLESLNHVGPENQIGVAAFNHQAYEISPLQYGPDRVELEAKIKRLYHFGGTLIEMGILQAMEMLESGGGSKNIVLISDGVTKYPNQAMTAAYVAADKGIRIYTVGVGARTNAELMMDIARATHGTYFAASDVNRLEILFGAADQKKPDGSVRDAVILDSNHFITDGVTLKAKIGGYNYVAPKSTAQLLVATNGGESLVTVWRIGLGRVGILATDDGSSFAGELYRPENSAIIVRLMNWLIGSPDRLEDKVVDVSDAWVGSRSSVTITAPQPPSVPGLDFIKVGEKSYATDLVPKEPGFQTIEGTVYAVNGPKEFWHVGPDPSVVSLVELTHGALLDPTGLDGLADILQARSKRTILSRDPYRWPFIVIAMVLYLVELTIRRFLVARLRRKIALQGAQ